MNSLAKTGREDLPTEQDERSLIPARNSLFDWKSPSIMDSLTSKTNLKIKNKLGYFLQNKRNVSGKKPGAPSVFKKSIVSNMSLREWKTTGKDEMMKHFKLSTMPYKKAKVKKEISKSVSFQRRTEIFKSKLLEMRQIYDLFSHYFLKDLKIEDILEPCKVLMKVHKGIAATVVDIIILFDCQSSVTENVEMRRKLARLCKSLEPIVSREILLERLDMDSLLEFNIVPNKQFNSRTVKIKTKLFYKQRKFNLYREESEGYSKLLLELSKATIVTTSTELLLGHIKSLIGYFNLDPNRVLDAMLNAFELRPSERKLFTALLNLYVQDKNRLREVLGFRFTYYIKFPETPKSMYVLTAILIQEGILTLDDILIWLQPDEKVILQEIEDKCKTPEKKPSSNKSPGNPIKVMKMAGNATNLYQNYLKNQKLVLCETFLLLGDWENFKTIMKKIGPRYVMSYPPVALSLCQLIHHLIDPLYTQYFKFGAKVPRKQRLFKVTPHTPDQVRSFIDLKNVLPMLFALKSALGYDPVLLFKIIRLVTAGIESIGDMDDVDLDENTIYYDGITLLDEVLLPTLSCLNSACCAAEAVWKLLKLYPFSSRFALYARWKSFADKYQIVLEKKYVGEYNIKIGMKRISKENVKQVGRLFGKATHFCAPALFQYILSHISMYDNLIGPVVEALRYLNTISCDALGYCILDFFFKEKARKSQTDGHSLAQWFQNLALFNALAHKKLSIDVSGVLNYVSQELVTHNCIDLIILKELLLKVTGIEIGDELPNHQYGAYGEGELMKIPELPNHNFHRNFKRSSIRMREALSKLKLTAPLAIMLAQERYHIAHQINEEMHIKLLGKLYDECHDVLLQFGTFLYTSSMLPEIREFPTLDELMLFYNLDIDVAFFLARPAIYRCVNETLSLLRQDKTRPLPNHFLILSEVIRPLSEVLKQSQPQRVWDEISPSFVALFWCLNLYDIYVPVVGNQMENKKSNQLTNMAAFHQKDTWFVPGPQRPAKNDVITSFLQLCILRRCIFSPSDALFCAQFIQLLHKLRTENFSTLLCYDRLLCDITYMATSCTENEATRYGQFLLALLQDVMRWHSSKAIYDKECANTPGFVTKFRGSTDGAANDNIHYENYRHVCHKWHFKLTKSLLTLLESKEYVQIRNGMIVLIKILPQFPVISRLAQCIEKSIAKIKEDEKNKRQDLYTLAVSYSGQLSAKMRTMIKESDFHKILPTPSTTPSTVPPTDEEMGKSAITMSEMEGKKVERSSPKQKKGRMVIDDSDKGGIKTKESKIKQKELRKEEEQQKLENKSGKDSENLLKEKDKDQKLKEKEIKEIKKEPVDKLQNGREKDKDLKVKGKDGKEPKNKVKDVKIKETMVKEIVHKGKELEDKEKKEKDIKEKERREKERKEKELKERREKDRKEKDVKDSEKKEKDVVKEKERREKELKERLEKELKEKERREKELKEKERKEKELKEKERKEKEIKLRKDKELKERKEKEQKDKERKEKESKERERKGKELKDKDRKDKEIKVKERKDKEQKEKECREKDFKEKERKEKELKEKREKDVKEKERREKELKDRKDRELKERKEKELKEKERKEKEIKEKDRSERDIKEGKDKELKERKERDSKDRERKEKEPKERKDKGRKEIDTMKERDIHGRNGSPVANLSSSSDSEFRGHESPDLDVTKQRKREFFIGSRDKMYSRDSVRRCEMYYPQYSDDERSPEIDDWCESPYIPLSKSESGSSKHSGNSRSFYNKKNVDVLGPDSKRRKVEIASSSKVQKYIERQIVITHEEKQKRNRPRKETDLKRVSSGQREKTPGSRDRSKHASD